MQTRILLLAALSLAAAAASAQNPLRVDPEVQRQRDQTRIAILQDEVVSEALGLAEAQNLLRSETARGDPRAAQDSAARVARHRQNISALAKELALSERATSAAPRSTAAANPDKPPPASVPLARIVPLAASEPPRSERRPAGSAVPEWVISGTPSPRTP